MAEWGLTPEYIINNWTDEEFALMVEKLNERQQREIDAISGKHSGHPISDKDLFRRMGKSMIYRGKQ